MSVTLPREHASRDARYEGIFTSTKTLGAEASP